MTFKSMDHSTVKIPFTDFREINIPESKGDLSKIEFLLEKLVTAINNQTEGDITVQSPVVNLPDMKPVFKVETPEIVIPQQKLEMKLWPVTVSILILAALLATDILINLGVIHSWVTG